MSDRDPLHIETIVDLERELDDMKDDVARAVIKCFWLYGGYTVDSRGPAGLLVDILERTRPSVATALREGGIEAAVEMLGGEL